MGHLQCQGQNNVPPGDARNTNSRGDTQLQWGDIPPSSLVIRALQYTVNTTNTFNAAVQDNAAAFLRSDYCHHGRSRFRLRRVRSNPTNPPPPATGMRFLYLSVSLVGQKNELGEVGNEKPSYDAVLNWVYKKTMTYDIQC